MLCEGIDDGLNFYLMRYVLIMLLRASLWIKFKS